MSMIPGGIWSRHRGMKDTANPGPLILSNPTPSPTPLLFEMNVDMGTVSLHIVHVQMIAKVY